MKGVWFAVACVGLAGCVPAARAVSETSSAPAPAVARTTVSAVAPPAVMPARYLRTLEYDPGGYSAEAAFGGDSDALLGDLLFHSSGTLGERARSMGISCDTCHPNGATHPELKLPDHDAPAGSVDLSSAFFRAANEDGVKNPINVPSLRGCRYTAPYGRDGRVASLSEFIRGVVETEFDGAPLSPGELSALTRYVLELDFLPNANLDARNELTARASDAARRGARLFAAPRDAFGGGSCASCHRPSAFFRDGLVHRLGSGSPSSPHSLDDGYETPTLLGLSETAPYFHDGRFATLAQVVDWFEQRFGLGLSPAQRSDLSAYLDAIGSVDRVRDDRPVVRRLDQVFAYVSLVTARNGPRIRLAAVDAVLAALHGEPPELRTRVEALRRRLQALRMKARAESMAPADLREARTLRSELSKLAGDWAGKIRTGSD